MGKIWQTKRGKLWLLCIIVILAGILTVFVRNPKIDGRFTDLLLVKEKPVDNRIKIIGIDEKSLQEMGPFSNWTRAEAAKLLESFDQENMPAVIGFDINYFGTRDEEGDQALVEAVKKSAPVVMASYLDFEVKLKNDQSEAYYMDTMNIDQIEKPYDGLLNISSHGFTNALQDTDNYVRRSLLKAEYAKETEYNFAYEIYRQYQKGRKEEPYLPKTSAAGVYGFDYTAQPGMYEIYSYTDVIHGKYDKKLFKDSIVLVGAYSSGMMDQYMVPIAKGTVMNGVEVQANHINALLSKRTFVEMPIIYRFLLSVGILLIFSAVAIHFRYGVSAAIYMILSVFVIGIDKLLYKEGIYFRCLNLFIILFLFFLIKTVGEYLLERKRRHGIMDMFCKYMEPQVVEQLSKKKNFEIELGGDNKEIAVLFVDLRGFTSLSEHMSPDVVVEILNAFLSMVTDAVFKNEGTIDKFIGDCAMAIFNAPINIDNYVGKAVQTGIDIVKGTKKINQQIQTAYGVEIACGVGIHCGNAIVGNIGSEYRVDYTAIGDTVNTAQRLESVAKGGQIFVSEAVIETMGDCFSYHFVEERSLKGKQDKIKVYCIEVMNETNIL